MEPRLHPVPAPLPSWWTTAVRAELEEVYRDVDREVESTGVVCWVSGLCCDFEKVDHVLYASSVEIAYVRDVQPESFSPGSALCPFWQRPLWQDGDGDGDGDGVGDGVGLCTLRERRPLGCRTYFCDERHRDRLEAIHVRFHERIREIVRRHRLPWRYLPFVASLRGETAPWDVVAGKSLAKSPASP